VPYVYNAAFSSSNVNVGTYDNSDWGTATPMPLMNLTPFASNLQGSLGGSPTTFLYDLANNSLPMYSFIEPRYSCAIGGNAPTVKHIAFNNSPNSNHPGSAFAPAPVSSALAPIDVADGEAFLKQLYNALNQSNYWGKTLLIITYDEHGGLYDHVAPPTATPPGQTTGTNSITIPDCSNTFGFNVYGCRVPTIVVSPYISPGSRIQPVSGRFDHTSLIRTAWDCLFTYANPPRTPAVSSLTQRDAEGNAASLYPSLDFSLSNNPGQL
jgi:phospholipase C